MTPWKATDNQEKQRITVKLTDSETDPIYVDTVTFATINSAASVTILIKEVPGGNRIRVRRIDVSIELLVVLHS